MEQKTLCHHGVKGMKWGVRRARKAQAKDGYKALKRQAKLEFDNAFQKHSGELYKTKVAFDNGNVSKNKYAAKELDYSRNVDKARAKKSEAIAKAKRDYRIAKGMNAEKANRKYNKKVNTIRQSLKDADYRRTVELVKSDPSVARALRDAGKIKQKDLNNASFDAIHDRMDEYIRSAEKKRRRG